jgi:hypothetical protein
LTGGTVFERQEELATLLGDIRLLAEAAQGGNFDQPLVTVAGVPVVGLEWLTVRMALIICTGVLVGGATAATIWTAISAITSVIGKPVSPEDIVEAIESIGKPVRTLT